MLDLASHDGRFSFAALHAGAARVVGIEHDPRLVQKAEENLALLRRAARRDYEFVAGDMFERIRSVESCDVVFCFGILYHINEHMRLLTELAEFDPRTDHLRHERVARRGRGHRAALAARGQPATARGASSRAGRAASALEAMWSSFGWTFEYFDWPGSGLADHPKLGDYAAGRRLTAVVTSGVARRRRPTCGPSAVREVLERRRDLPTQWLTITDGRVDGSA